MKKAVLFLFAVISITASFAKTHKIKVSNFQFSPATTNAVVGDTILFVWVSGGHTTTSTTIPAGAASWNANMNSGSKKFTYVLVKKGTYNFMCNIHPSMTGKIKVTKQVAAGFELSDISADDAQAFVKWNVNQGNDVSYFSVQRSKDGNNFTEISKLNASSLSNYKYKDEDGLTEKYYYYQVEAVDKNGNSQLSDIKMFSSSGKSNKLIISISPNPLTNPGHLMLQFNADKEGKMLVQLYTQNGKLINEAEMAANKGLNNGHFHLGNLTPGSYYIICTLGNLKEKHVIMYQ